METHLDRFGRVIIPKLLRSHLGLRAGSALIVEEHGNEIRLRPVQETPAFGVKEGVWVFRGQASGNLSQVVQSHRQERLEGFRPRPNP
ncbi:MAG: AbrB/MazE/SpoVT family DNA-binding domain-containing protein [Candidatus Omnitrophica bacterium]|nr:AbrB/MazE/SpoVT family DNA-binding domain-containing protein [Candidatus Omnitrophota bacterium]